MLAPLPRRLRSKVFGHFALYNCSLGFSTFALRQSQHVALDAPRIAAMALGFAALNLVAWFVNARRGWVSFEPKPGKRRIW